MLPAGNDIRSEKSDQYTESNSDFFDTEKLASPPWNKLKSLNFAPVKRVQPNWVDQDHPSLSTNLSHLASTGPAVCSAALTCVYLAVVAGSECPNNAAIIFWPRPMKA